MGAKAMSKARKRTQEPRDADYRAAWRACGVTLSTRVWGDDAAQIDLRTRLGDLLKSGWSIQALRSYASKWQIRRYDHITPATWRWAVYFASINIAGEATTFLKDFNTYVHHNG